MKKLVKRLGLLVIAGNLLLVGVGTVLANSQQDPVRKGPGYRFEDCRLENALETRLGPWGHGLRRLNLTSEQLDQVKKIHLQQAEAMLELRNQLAEKRAHLRTLSTAAKVDMDDLNDVIEEIGALKTKQMKQHMAMHQAVRKILTREQQLMFDMSSRHHRGGERGMGFRKGRRGGRGEHDGFHHTRRGNGRYQRPFCD